MPPTTVEQPPVQEPVMDTPTVETPDTPAPETGSAGNPLLVTSSSSRASYAENVNTMNDALSNLSEGTPQNYNYVDAAGKLQTVSAMSPEEAQQKMVNPDPHTGVITPTVDAKDGNTTTTPETKSKDGTTPAADGSVDNGDGTITTAEGARIDSSLKKLYDNSITLLDSGIATAKANLQRAAATMKKNPAAQAAIAQIMAKFEEQIGLMKDKNRQLMGGNITNAARSGGLQYANEMTGNFLSDEQDRAINRITDLQAEETNLILKTQESFKKGDVAAFEAASKALDKANESKLKAITDLMKTTDTIVKTKQAQQKIDQAAAKQQITDDIRLSTGLAAGVAEAIAASGITDEKKKREYIEQMAAQSGITNADLLESAVTKAALAARNTKSIITKRTTTGSGGSGGGGKPVTDGNFTYTPQDVATYSSFLSKGGEAPDGTTYNGRGDDGYVDPGAYNAAFQDWENNGGTPQGFAKKFPVKSYVNPDGYDAIPAVLRPTAKKTTTSAPA